MVAEPNAPHRATLADLERTPDDGRRYELILGEIVVSAAPTWMHQRVVGQIYRRLAAYAEEHDLGEVQFAPTDVVLWDGTVVQPDIVFVATHRLDGIGEDGRFHGPPDLVVEVLSPTTQGRDMVTKQFLYARAGVRESWLIDPAARTILVLTLSDAIYLPAAADDAGRQASTVLPGLIVDPAAVFAAAGLPPVE